MACVESIAYLRAKLKPHVRRAIERRVQRKQLVPVHIEGAEKWQHWVRPETLASPIDGIREGVRFMRRTPSISSLMKFVTIYSVLGVPYLTLMPVVARDQLHRGAGGYGALLACVGVGGCAARCHSPRSAIASDASGFSGSRRISTRSF